MKRRIERCTIIAFAMSLVIGVSANYADATTISGTGPFTITEDTQLVGDVDCSTVTTVDCITFAAPTLLLDLNGFTITGPSASPCTVQAGHAGISTNGQAQAQIQGPGKVQNFRDGIFVSTGSDQSLVQDIVAIRNCVTGITVDSNAAQIRENIVLNTTSFGIYVTGNNNNVQANEVHGNTMANGIAVTGNGNTIEKNSVTTSFAGIVLFSGTSNNTVDKNLVLNNKPSVDIFDGGLGNTVTLDNVCELGSGAAATICAISPTRPFAIDHAVGNP